MTVDRIIAFLQTFKGKMPLPSKPDWLRSYVALNIDDNTIRVVTGKGSITGICLWKMTTEERGEPGVWERSSKGGDILVVYHLVTLDRVALARMVRYLIDRYDFKEVWGERSGEPKRYTRKFMERLACYGQGC